MVKPGITTSELWVTIATAVGMVLVAFNLAEQAMVDNLIDAIGKSVTAMVALISAVYTVVQYIKSRTAVKTWNSIGNGEGE